MITRRPLQLWQIWCKSVYGGFWANGWNVTNFFYLFMPLFSGTYLQIRRVNGFSRMMAQTTRTLTRMCLLGFRWCGSPFRGHIPKTQFWAWIGVDKPNSQNRKTCILSKLLTDSNQILHSDKDHQMPFVSGPKMSIINPRWRTAAILEKSKNRHILVAVWPIVRQFRPNLAQRRSSTLLTPPTVKISKI